MHGEPVDRLSAMAASTSPQTARLLIACPDARGIVAAVTSFIADHGGNLLDSDQHTDAQHGEFFMRAVFDLAECDLQRDNFEAAWSPVSRRFDMSWDVRWSDTKKRMAILVGKQAHCLQDLLWRWQAGELPVDITAILSNHPNLESIADSSGVRFHCLPIKGEKPAQERRVVEILEQTRSDLVVLARYMQVLSADLLAAWRHPIINIHHSFLPAFAGGDPYRRAYDRGVKLIGATSHYVTEELDEGPIIAQAVTHVSHRDSVADLRRRGRDLERVVLAEAVRLHVEDKILVSKNKTVVFG